LDLFSPFLDVPLIGNFLEISCIEPLLSFIYSPQDPFFFYKECRNINIFSPGVPFSDTWPHINFPTFHTECQVRCSESAFLGTPFEICFFFDFLFFFAGHRYFPVPPTLAQTTGCPEAPPLFPTVWGFRSRSFSSLGLLLALISLSPPGSSKFLQPRGCLSLLFAPVFRLLSLHQRHLLTDRA